MYSVSLEILQGGEAHWKIEQCLGNIEGEIMKGGESNLGLLYQSDILTTNQQSSLIFNHDICNIFVSKATIKSLKLYIFLKI